MTTRAILYEGKRMDEELKWDPLAYDVLIFPNVSGNHCSFMLATIACDIVTDGVMTDAKAMFGVNVMHYDPVVRDTYNPKSFATIKEALIRIGNAVWDKANTWATDNHLGERISSIRHWNLPARNGFHQEGGGPCVIMTLMMIRCILEDVKHYSITMDEVLTRGPAFGFEGAFDHMLPLGYGDRHPGNDLSVMDPVSDAAYAAAVAKHTQDGRYLSHCHRLKVGLDWAPGNL